MSKHIPRRSGAVGIDRDLGPRQVLKPKAPRMRYRRFAGNPGLQCGAVHPGRPGIVDDTTGEQLVDPVYCTSDASFDLVTGEHLAHRGKHRARVLHGVLERWEDEVPA